MLPPWSRAPLLSLRRPAVLLAVVGAAAVVACAASSGALFLSSAASESLRVQLAAQCPDAAFPVLAQSGFSAGGAAQANADRSARQELTAAGLAAPYSVVEVDGTVALDTGSQSTLGHVFFRDGAVDNVTVLSSSPGDGLLLPQQTARYLRVDAGDLMQIGGEDFIVAGTYRELYDERTVRTYWCSYTSLFLNASSGAAPPALVLATSPQVAEEVGQVGGQTGMARAWVSPIDTEGLTLDRARGIVAARERAFAESSISNAFGGEGRAGLLPDMVRRTERVAAGLRGPVIPIALGGAVAAVFLMGAAGSYWAERRRQEVRLLSSRGVSPASLAVKAALELSMAAVVGTVGGWLLARGLIAALGPSPYLDADAPRQAAMVAAAGLLAGIFVLMLVAGLRTRGSTERPIGGGARWASRVPWELALIVAAAVSWLLLRGGDAVVVENNVAQVRFLLVSFPLLFLAGTAVLVVRLLVLLLPRMRRIAARQRPAMYLAAARVSSAAAVSAALLVTVALPIGMLTYAATLTDTSEATLEAKARVVVGSDIAVISVDEIARSPALDDVGTIVERYPRGSLYGETVTVLAVDPDTFGRWAFWLDSFAAEPLPDLLETLTSAGGSGVAAVGVGVPTGVVTVTLGQRDVAMSVQTTADTFPGRRQPDPILVVDRELLGEVDITAGRFSEVWSTRGQADVLAAIDVGTRVSRVQDRDTVFDVANFQAVEWTFGYLQALAAFVALIAVGGLLLYLETRQRSRVASYALARRMGLTAGTHLRSLVMELEFLLGVAFVLGGGLGATAVLTVYRRLEIDPSRPPGPLLTLPGPTIAAAAATVGVLALLAAGYAHRAATRADMAEVLRLTTT